MEDELDAVLKKHYRMLDTLRNLGLKPEDLEGMWDQVQEQGALHYTTEDDVTWQTD